MPQMQWCAQRLLASGFRNVFAAKCSSSSIIAAKRFPYSTSAGSGPSTAAKSTARGLPTRLGSAFLAAAGLAGGASLIASSWDQRGGGDAPHLLTSAQAQASAAAGNEAEGTPQPLHKGEPTGSSKAEHMMAAAAAEPPASAPGWWARLTGSGATADAAGQQPADGITGSTSPSGSDSGNAMQDPTGNASAATAAAAAGQQPRAPGGALQGPEAEPEGWWAWLKAGVGAAPAPAPPVYVPLPTDKLSCKLPADRRSGGHRQPVVLLACGSFNPPTIAHLRMFELASDALREEGFDVLGGYLSPVNDAYGKPDLVPANHRVRMAELAAATSEGVMVDPWEAAQPGWQRTLAVMRRVAVELSGKLDPEQARGIAAAAQRPAAEAPAAVSTPHPDAATADAADFPGSHDGAAAVTTADAAASVPGQTRTDGEDDTGLPAESVNTPAAAAQPPATVQPPADGSGSNDASGRSDEDSGSSGAVSSAPRVMLLCGADLVESFATPGVWRREHLQQIMGPGHGVVCIARRGAEVRRLVAPGGSGGGSSNALSDLAAGIRIIEDPVALDVSSSKLRSAIEQGKSVKYLTPDAVLAYIKTHRLYSPAVDGS